MKILPDIKLDFSDVLIVPKSSPYSSRSEVSLDRHFHFKYSSQEWDGVPIMVSNMDTTGTIAMALETQKHKIITCLHKYYTWRDIPQDLDRNFYAVSTGITQTDLHNFDEIMTHINPHIICIDVANGYMTSFVTQCRLIREKYPEKIIIAGNVCTPEGVQELIVHGKVDIVKIGIGSGSCCTTRKQTGVGYPQLSAIIECADTAHGLDAHVISDGGLQVIGDFSKAYSGGADFVMAGSMFAGHTESGGDLVTEIDERTGKSTHYKLFYGMSSTTAMNLYKNGVARYKSSEGKTVRVPYKGAVEQTLLDIQGGVRSCMTYIGAKKIKDIPKCVTLIQVNRQMNYLYGE
jgi:GMP reductase